MVYLTREEYEVLRERAVEQYERLYAIVPNGTEIVYVLTRDVYRTVMAIDTEPHNLMTIGFGDNGFYGLFHGARVCVVNEDTDNSMFAPAVCGRIYYQGMRLEDVILIEDNHLYSLRSIEPDVMFVDTGLTVSFDGAIQATAVRRMDNAADMTTTIEADVAYARDAAPVETVRATIDWDTVLDNDPATVYATQAPQQLDIDWDEITRIIAGAVTLNTSAAQSVHRRQEKPKEEELSPGDTKELDDFLDSFMRSAT